MAAALIPVASLLDRIFILGVVLLTVATRLALVSVLLGFTR